MMAAELIEDDSPPGPVTKDDIVEAMAESIEAEFAQASETEAQRWRRKWLEESELADTLRENNADLREMLATKQELVTELRIAIRDIERHLVSAVSLPIDAGAGRRIFDALEIIKQVQKF